MDTLNSTPATLFPILQPGPKGIARMAIQARHAADGHLIQFRALQARSLMNKSVSRRRNWIAWSINPYRGCEFGCKYCFARYTHEFLQPFRIDSNLHKLPAARTAPRDPQAWASAFEHEIYMKQNAAWLLQQELRRFNPEDDIVIGTATDPYQPIERRMRITRSILEVFARRSGYNLGIITKSALIARDIDLLREVTSRNRIVIHLTITTTDTRLARMVEPRAPRPDLRFAAVKKLRDAGITVGIMCCPLLPGLNDTPEQLEGMAARAAEVRANFLAANPLFLKLCSRPTFLSFVREHFPHLLADYESRYARSDFADEDYARNMGTLMDKLRRKYKIPSRSSGELFMDESLQNSKPPASVAAPQQRQLFA